jgi:hypothetical protein
VLTVIGADRILLDLKLAPRPDRIARCSATDGTAAGTSLVRDIYAGPSSASPTNFALMGTSLFFTATDASHPIRLWYCTT